MRLWIVPSRGWDILPQSRSAGASGSCPPVAGTCSPSPSWGHPVPIAPMNRESEEAKKKREPLPVGAVVRPRWGRDRSRSAFLLSRASLPSPLQKGGKAVREPPPFALCRPLRALSSCHHMEMGYFGHVPRKIRKLIAELEKAGFVNRGGKGSHRNFLHKESGVGLTLSGQKGADAKIYQEKDVAEAIRKSTCP